MAVVGAVRAVVTAAAVVAMVLLSPATARPLATPLLGAAAIGAVVVAMVTAVGVAVVAAIAGLLAVAIAGLLAVIAAAVVLFCWWLLLCRLLLCGLEGRDSSVSHSTVAKGQLLHLCGSWLEQDSHAARHLGYVIFSPRGLLEC